MTIDEMIEVLQAAKRGEVIQARFTAAAEGRWCDVTGPVWDFDSYEYRAKPREPREWWMVGTHAGGFDRSFVSREAARAYVLSDRASPIVHVREVLDDD